MSILDDPFVSDIFSKYVKGKSFIDIGPLYAISNEALTPAMQHGATRIAAADIQDISWEPWKKLREHCASLGLHEYEEHSVDLDNPNIEKIIGKFDFVFCKGIIYHVPSPLYTIERLRSVTAKYLLIGTMIVPDFIENECGRIDFDGGKVLFVPALDHASRAIMAKHYSDQGWEIMHINAKESWPWRHDGGPNYGPWWWLFSGRTAEKMVEVSGLRIIASETGWGGRHQYIFCERDDS